MKKISIALAALILGSGLALAAVDAPKLPVDISQFNLESEWDEPCGKVSWLLYSKNDSADSPVWAVMFVNRSTKPNPFIVVRDGNRYELWLDKNRDGVFDEYFLSKDDIVAKYPKLCDAVSN